MEGYIRSARYILGNLRISLKVTSILTIHVVGTILLALSINYITDINIYGTDISDTPPSNSSELRHENEGGSSNQRTHSDLIRSCSTFREILSTDMAFSCDYSMLYYKGQCEHYSLLLKHNETETLSEVKNDLSFCSDSRIDRYIREHGLNDAPRSPTLVPGYESPVA
ncbi:MAG: hypothetical protein WBX01_05425 [Nitrososphaeraceae archaeon]